MAAGGVALIGAAGDAQAGAFMYGITAAGQIVEYNPELKTAPTVLNTIASSTNGNGLAYDFNALANRERIWTFDTNLGLRYYDRATNFLSGTIVSNAQLNTLLNIGGSAVPEFRNAAFYDGAYWFIVPSSIAANSQTRLVRVAFAEDANGVPTFKPYSALDATSSSAYELASGNFPVGTNCAVLRCGRYGDIAIDASTGFLYGSNEDYFFRLNIAGLPSSNPGGSPSPQFQLGSGRFLLGQTTPLISSTQSDVLQLSFNSDYTKLYGVNNFSGKWYEINFNTSDPALLGARTEISGYNTVGISDLGGASGTAGEPVPGPLPLLGAGVAFHASRRLRRRIRA